MKRVLLVVDAQRIYTDPDSEMYCVDSKNTMNRINRIIHRFQDQNEPIVLIRHIHKRDGSDLGRLFDFSGDAVEDFNFKEGTPEVEYDSSLVVPNDVVEITKNRYSAFAGTSLERHLRGLAAERVVICGFMTNFCCESTARNAHDLDFFVDFIADATGTPGTESMDEERIREVVAELLGEGFARVFDTKAYLSTI